MRTLETPSGASIRRGDDMKDLLQSRKRMYILPTTIIIVLTTVLVLSTLQNQLASQPLITCQPIFAYTTLESSGFLFSKKHPIYGSEFVLKPSSTGHITITYNSPNNFTRLITNNGRTAPSEFLKPVNVLYKINGADPFIPIDINATGMIISLTDTTVLNDNVIKVNYVVNATSYAQRGTYIFQLWSTCRGVLITIEDSAR